MNNNAAALAARKKSKFPRIWPFGRKKRNQTTSGGGVGLNDNHHHANASRTTSTMTTTATATATTTTTAPSNRATYHRPRQYKPIKLTWPKIPSIPMRYILIFFIMMAPFLFLVLIQVAISALVINTGQFICQSLQKHDISLTINELGILVIFSIVWAIAGNVLEDKHIAFGLFQGVLIGLIMASIVNGKFHWSGIKLPNLVNKMKSIKNSQALQTTTELCECAICLEIVESDNVCKVLQCQHIFHGKCVEQWLRVNQTCPLCRERNCYTKQKRE